MDLEVRHLRAIHAIAHHGSISKAASHLGLSQPTLAGQLQRIERALGGRLFDRQHEGCQPTALGGWILERSSALLGAFDTLQREVRSRTDTGQDRPLLRVGCGGTALDGHVSNSLYDHIPEAEVAIRSEECLDTLYTLLGGGRLELAVLGDYPGYELRPLPGVEFALPAVEPVFVGLSSDHPLAARAEIELSDLADEEWALPPLAESGHHGHFWSACGKHGFAPRLTFLVAHALAYDLIRAGRCVALFRATARERPGLAVRPLIGSPLLFRHVLGWPVTGPVAAVGPKLVAAAMEGYWREARSSPIYSTWLEHNRDLLNARAWNDRA
jgi:DNA-binding transcriptional LysR family regulator